MTQNSFTQQFTFLTNFAKQQLAKHSEFYPFGSVIETNGELHALAVHLGTEHPTSKALLDEYDKIIPAMIKDKSITAAAVCLNASYTNPSRNAIVVEIENDAGEAATVLVPYKQTAHSYEYGSPLISQRLPKWFATEGAEYPRRN